MLSAAFLTPDTGFCEVLGGDLRIALKGTTDYFFRGISQTDGESAIQAGVDFEHNTGIFGGLWASTVEFEFERALQVANPRDIELNTYLGFKWRMNPSWSTVYSVTRYSYPDSSIDADFTEFTVAASFQDHIFAAVSYSPEGYANDESTVNYEAGVEYPVFKEFVIGGNFGAFDFSGSRYSTFTYWDIGISRWFRFLMIDVRYHDTDGDAKDNFFNNAADSQWVLSISTGLAF